jgi:hypothetical protein
LGFISSQSTDNALISQAIANRACSSFTAPFDQIPAPSSFPPFQTQDNGSWLDTGVSQGSIYQNLSTPWPQQDLLYSNAIIDPFGCFSHYPSMPSEFSLSNDVHDCFGLSAPFPSLDISAPSWDPPAPDDGMAFFGMYNTSEECLLPSQVAQAVTPRSRELNALRPSTSMETPGLGWSDITLCSGALRPLSENGSGGELGNTTGMRSWPLKPEAAKEASEVRMLHAAFYSKSQSILFTKKSTEIAVLRLWNSSTQPFYCPVCRFRMAMRKDMKRHVQFRHPEYCEELGIPWKPRTVCPISTCKFSNHRKDNLQRHIQNTHPEWLP